MTLNLSKQLSPVSSSTALAAGVIASADKFALGDCPVNDRYF